MRREVVTTGKRSSLFSHKAAWHGRDSAGPQVAVRTSTTANVGHRRKKTCPTTDQRDVVPCACSQVALDATKLATWVSPTLGAVPAQRAERPRDPVGSQHSCQPTVKLHILHPVWNFPLGKG